MQNNLLFRFYLYQKERFPFISHGLLIAIFTFSAISYSIITSGKTNFISIQLFIPVVINTVSMFFLLRVSDEFKDKVEDAQFRPYLPVPRGLISLKELALIAVFVVVIQLVLNIIYFPKMLVLFALVAIVLFFMRYEFFIPSILRKSPVLYIGTHMIVIPAIDFYASGSDWLLTQYDIPRGLIFFILVSYMNGTVIEFGRKIRAPENEEHNTYSTLYGRKKATHLWMLLISATFIFAQLASLYAGYGLLGAAILLVIYGLCLLPAFFFLKNMSVKNSKWIEKISGIWTILMYLTLGGFPMFVALIKKFI